MHVIRARNVHAALPLGLAYLRETGIPMPSRAGNVIAAPGPVTTVYERPTERVLFWPERDANPFFHLFEALWMLAGRKDLAFLTPFVKRMKNFSDDGVTLQGAYGYRWRKHWTVGVPGGKIEPIDQLERAITLLKSQPYSRRAVITMFDPVEDLRTDEGSKDIPCNLMIDLGISYGKRDEPNRLNMMTVARSHDIIWGAYGANAVHFSFLQEYLAKRLELAVGTYTQVSWNYHAYEDVFAKTYRGALAAGAPSTPNPYEAGTVAPYPIMTHPDAWDRDLALFMEDPSAYGYTNLFFSSVAKPLWYAHRAYKRGDMEGALDLVDRCKAQDWRVSCREWLLRRQNHA
jgi:hypothetical protein